MGIDVRTAYEVVHKDQLQPQMMAVAAQQTERRLSTAIQSGSRRVAENGLSPSSGAVPITNDPSALTPEQRRQLVMRAKRGEVIPF